jgi:hypothetical protein
MPQTQVWRVLLNNALNALAEDFSEVVIYMLFTERPCT